LTLAHKLSTLFDVTLGERLRSARLLAGISTKEVDRLAGTTPGHTWWIESSKGGTEVGTVDKVTKVLGVSLDYLIRGEGPKPSAKQIRAAVEAARTARANAVKGGSAPTEAA